MVIGVSVGLVIVIVVGVYFWNRQVQVKQQAEPMPFVRRKYLCNKEERNFFRYLVRAVSRDYLILTKVRMTDLITVDGALPGRKKMEALEQINTRRADFVLVDRATTEVRLVIELYDDRLSSTGRVQQALFLDKLFAAVRIPMLRCRVSENYHISDLKKAILSAERLYEDKQPQTAIDPQYAALERQRRRPTRRTAAQQRQQEGRSLMPPNGSQGLLNHEGEPAHARQEVAKALTDGRPSRIKVA